MREDISPYAVSLDGTYIEDVLEGYTTIGVTGRGALTPQLDTYTISNVDGERTKGSTYPARSITVFFALKADGEEELRDRFNELNRILAPKEQEIIFNDEVDKYFVGEPLLQSDLKEMWDASKGKFIIHCGYPFKKSVFEHQVEPTLDDGKTFACECESVKPSKPIFEIVFNSDCGYVTIMDDKEHILQFGDINETDGQTTTKNETVFNSVFG